MRSESISVLRINDVLLVSMPMDPDDETVSELQVKTLDEMDKRKVRALVLDLSKVETLDSYFAKTVTDTAKMVTLMGGETVIAGMRPSVAITATQLGLNLGMTQTALSLDLALNRTRTAIRW